VIGPCGGKHVYNGKTQKYLVLEKVIELEKVYGETQQHLGIEEVGAFMIFYMVIHASLVLENNKETIVCKISKIFFFSDTTQ